jgi:uncharacterized glyoxalase superfamily protein PhnB
MKLAATVIYVDGVPDVLEFYRRAFGVEPRFLDLDVQLPGREPGALYQFAVLDFPEATLQFATHALGTLLMPAYSRPESGGPSGIEVAFYTDDVPGAFARAVEAGAEVVAPPE